MTSGKLPYFVLVGALLQFCSGCSLAGDDKETIIQVDAEFSISLLEQLGSTRQLVFELASVETDSCLNSTIDRSISVHSDQITLLLDGIVPASDCNPGEAPATGLANAGSLTNGIYNVAMTIRNTINDEGVLTVDNEKYALNMLTSDGVSIQNGKLYRIPNQLIWGWLAYDDPGAVGDLPQQFLLELDSLTTSLSLNDGYYGSFTIDAGGQMVMRTPPPNSFSQTYYRQFTGDESQLKALLEHYRTEAAGAMQLVLYTAAGKEL